MTNSLGTLIKTERKNQGLTQQELADIIHCQKEAVSMWENGKRNVPQGRFEELSNALNIPLEMIVSLAKNDETMTNDFNKQYFELKTVQDAMNFIEFTLKDFEIDALMKVSLSSLLRNYLLLALLITMIERPDYEKQEGKDFVWDYTWFKANVDYAAINQLFEQKHRKLYGKMIDSTCDELEFAGARLFEVLDSFLRQDVIDYYKGENILFALKLHLLQYCRHLDDLACGSPDPTNHFYCSDYF